MVSVVLCTYNGAKFIIPQLESIANQTYIQLEVIICDDASTDNTCALIEDFIKDKPNFKLHRNEKNLGYTKNFFKGFHLSTAPHIAVCDQDDVWVNTKLEKMMQVWVPQCPLIYCDSVMFKHGDEMLITRNHKLSRRFEGTDARKIFLFNTISGHALIFRRSILKDFETFFPGDIYYDWWLGIYAACHGGVQYVNEVLVFQRRHGDNASGKPEENSAAPPKYRKAFNQIILKHLIGFATVPQMPTEQKAFLNELIDAWRDMITRPFSKKLFGFLFKHRHLIYFKKVRKLGIFSHIKHSYYFSRNQGYGYKN